MSEIKGPFFSIDSSTFYTTIPHENLKPRLKEIIRSAFYFKNGK
jgi:hypothetical protein